MVADRLRKHAHDPSKADVPILVFPEGTCVNNEYVVQFKKGVFELGVPINPVAIKYNKVRGRVGGVGVTLFVPHRRPRSHSVPSPLPCRCLWTRIGTPGSSPSAGTCCG